MEHWHVGCVWLQQNVLDLERIRDKLNLVSCSKNFRILLIAITLSVCQNSYGQVKGEFAVESGAGILLFDEILSFEPSPTLGLGAGYGITNFLQLDLAFLFSPTQQRISLAASKLKSRVSFYSYSFNLSLCKCQPIWDRIRPFVKAGVGGVLFQTRDVTLDLGGGNAIHVDGQTDHQLTLLLGGGIALLLSKRLNLIMEYRMYLFRLQRVLNDGLQSERVWSDNSYLGLGLSVTF